jgi:tRNA modification GTPase
VHQSQRQSPGGAETIVAISTPPGRGGIGIVRLSGPEAVAIATPMLRLKGPLGHAQARFAEILDEAVPMSLVPGPYVPASSRIDEAVVTFFAAPNSYTAEDIVEIAAHGSPVVLDMLVRHALARGARLAEPGEFTQRAFLSGRIDLTQAEAVRDLIDAQTLYQARVAASQLGGALSRRVQPAKDALVTLIATLEAGIDFAEDDIDVMPNADILQRIEALRAQLAPIEASFAQGRIVHSGLTLAIVGRPNAGKSSLFNCLVERERAIVTATPGTTRDLVTEQVAIGGIPVNLIDTAGLREAFDEAEAIGIQKSREALAEADIVLLVFEALTTHFEIETELLAALHGRNVVKVLNKVDLIQAPAPKRLPEEPLGAVAPAVPVDLSILVGAVPVSAKTGAGVDRLRSTILEIAQAGAAQDQSGMITNLRQHQATAEALKSLEAAAQSTAARIPLEMVMLDLYAALRSLDALTGQTTPDDILNQIFSTFCIGK